MKRLTLPLVLICLAGAGRAQLLPDQKLLDFQQLAALYANQYDGKALIDFIDPSLGRGFSFRVGDELISIDGKTVADWLKEFGKYNAFGNPRSTDRSSASLITFRDQSIYPRAAEIGESATV